MLNPTSRTRSQQLHSPTKAMPSELAALHGSRVAVHIVIQGREQFLRGRAAYESDVDLGKSLRVNVADPDGDFEIIVAESQWDGKILPGKAVGCDYLIRLNEPNPS